MRRACRFTWVVVLIFVGCLSQAQRLRDRCEDHSDGAACWQLAQLHASGSGGAEKSAGKASRYMNQACELKDDDACMAKALVCRATGDCEKPPDPGPDSGEKKKVQLERAVQACNANRKDGCLAALVILKDVCNDDNKVECVKLMLPIMRKLCDLGAEEACKGYAEIAMKICEQGDGCACAELGRMMVLGRKPVPPNMAMGRKLLRIGCRTCGQSEACELTKSFP